MKRWDLSYLSFGNTPSSRIETVTKMNLQNHSPIDRRRRKSREKPLLFDVKWLLKDSIYVKEIQTIELDDEFHYHDVYEIALILNSKGTRIIGDSIENFVEGDLVFIGPQVPHIAYKKDDSVNSHLFHALVIYFQPNWLTETQLDSENFVHLRKLLNDTKRGIKISGETRHLIAKKIIELRKHTGLKAIINLLDILETASQSKEYECLASEGYSNVFNPKDIERLDTVYKYIRDHFTDPITLEDIASISNMTPTAFCKFFKNKTRKTFSNFVNEVRVGYACKLLFDEDLTISEVCYRCGFNNLTSFNINFKEITKKTPSEYRQNLKNKL